jgi:hypothetical protein
MNAWIVYGTEQGDWGCVSEDEFWVVTYKRIFLVNKIVRMFARDSRDALMKEAAERVVSYAEMVNLGLFEHCSSLVSDHGPMV